MSDPSAKQVALPQWVLAWLPALVLISLLTSPHAISSAASAEIQPSLELLEYLGLLVEVDDEWIGPELFNGNDSAKEEHENESKASTENIEQPVEGKTSDD